MNDVSGCLFVLVIDWVFTPSYHFRRSEVRKTRGRVFAMARILAERMNIAAALTA